MLANEYLKKEINLNSRKEKIKYAKQMLKKNKYSFEGNVLYIEQIINPKTKIKKLKKIINHIDYSLVNESLSKAEISDLTKQYQYLMVIYLKELIMVQKYQEALNETLKIFESDEVYIKDIYYIALKCCAYLGKCQTANFIVSLYNDNSLMLLVPLMILEFSNGNMVNFVSVVNTIKENYPTFIKILGSYLYYDGFDPLNMLETGIFTEGDCDKIEEILHEYVDLIFDNDLLIEWFINHELINDE